MLEILEMQMANATMHVKNVEASVLTPFLLQAMVIVIILRLGVMG